MEALIVIFFIIIPALFALACAGMAKSRGRSPALGAVLGFCFGIFAVIGYAIAGETEEKKVDRMRKAMNYHDPRHT